MGVDTKEFECLEQLFNELVSEFQSLSISSSQLREALRTEAARAEAAEASRDATERASADEQANNLAAAAATAQAAKVLATLEDELTTVKMELEFAVIRHLQLKRENQQTAEAPGNPGSDAQGALAMTAQACQGTCNFGRRVDHDENGMDEMKELEHRQRSASEDKCIEMINKTTLLERELQNLRPLEATNSTLQRQLIEMHERIHKTTEDAQSELSRLESELRRVERCASAGVELRERARLAAAAHARDRRLASAELQHTARELQTAKAKITRQAILIAELECRLSKSKDTKKTVDPELESFIEVKANVEAERAGTERLEKALAAALADNAILAAELRKHDNNEFKEPSPEYSTSTNICPIDSFLAE